MWSIGVRQAWVSIAPSLCRAAPNSHQQQLLFGYRYLYVAYVDAVKRVGSNVVAVAFGRFFFDETDARRRLLAALVMSAGVALVLAA